MRCCFSMILPDTPGPAQVVQGGLGRSACRHPAPGLHRDMLQLDCQCNVTMTPDSCTISSNPGRHACAQDLLNIARTTLSSKILTHDKDHFAALAVDAVMRLRGSTNLESINIIKKPGGTLRVPPLAAPCCPPPSLPLSGTSSRLSCTSCQKITQPSHWQQA